MMLMRTLASNIYRRVQWIWRLSQCEKRILRPEADRARMLQPRNIHLSVGDCTGLPDFSTYFVDPILSPRPGDIVRLEPLQSGLPTMCKFFDLSADGGWLLRTVDVVFKFPAHLYRLTGVVARVDIPPANTVAPSLRWERLAVQTAADNAHFREACRTVLAEERAGIRHDFSECLEPVAMAREWRTSEVYRG